VASYLSAYILIGLPLALNGAGVWALVCAQLAQAGSYALAVYLSVRHALIPSFKADQSGMFGFGSKVLLSNLSSWGYTSLDAAIIGRMLGVVDLGLYNRSMNLLASPMFAVVATLQGVLFPLYSRLANRIEEARRIYPASICLLGVLMLPIFAAIAVIPETTILALYGDKWSAATPLITPLALAMPVYAILALGGPLMLGLGRAGKEAVTQTLGLVVMVIAVIAAARISLVAVAWTVLLVYLLRALLVTRLAVQVSGLDGAAIVRALAGPAWLAGLAAAVAGSVDQLSTAQHPVLRLIIDLGITGAVVAALIFLLGRRVFCIEAKHLLWQARPHLPGVLQEWVRRWCELDMSPQPTTRNIQSRE
jgi:PST family polysaccharide transporter